MSQLKEIYAGQRGTDFYERSLFLAGPTSRDYNVKSSWRPEMCELLRKYGFKGYVFIPELEGYVNGYNYIEQINWEVRHLNRADMIAYWVPRDEKILPGFTTNVEYGEFMGSGKVVLGYPLEAVHCGYLHARAVMHGNVPIFHTMDSMALHIAQKFKELDLSRFETTDTTMTAEGLTKDDLIFGHTLMDMLMENDNITQYEEVIESQIKGRFEKTNPVKRRAFLSHTSTLLLNVMLNKEGRLYERALAGRFAIKAIIERDK